MSHLNLKPASNTFKTYSGSVLPLNGETEVLVDYQGQGATLSLIVADVDGKPVILGRNWLSFIKLNWHELFSVSTPNSIDEKTAILKPLLSFIRRNLSLCPETCS